MAMSVWYGTIALMDIVMKTEFAVCVTETGAQTVWYLNVVYDCVGSVLQSSTLRRRVVCELVGWRWNDEQTKVGSNASVKCL